MSATGVSGPDARIARSWASPAAHAGRDRRAAWMVRIVATMVAVLVVVWAREVLLTDGGRPTSRVQRVALVQTPRAPPKPPDKLPEPVRETEARVESSIAPLPDAPVAAHDHLGLDADAQGAGDAFGLVGRRGGREITSIGSGDGGDGVIGGTATPSALSRFNHLAYAGLVTQRVRTELVGNRRLTEHDYIAVVQIWIDRFGRVQRTELETGSGRAGTDSAIRDALARIGPVPAPPPDLPQPIRLRITSREITVGATMPEQNDEWSLNRRYVLLEGLHAVSVTVPTRLSALAR